MEANANSPVGSNPSVVQESSKTSSSAEQRKENGTRVSENGGGDVGGGELGDGEEGLNSRASETQVLSGNDVDDKKVEVNASEEGVVDDREMNGASSLLEIQKREHLRELGSVLDVIDNEEKKGSESGENVAKHSLEFSEDSVGESEGMKGDGDVEEERNGDMEGGEQEFNVGDFVWGKIKSHPWWPGRIYDPEDASDYAKKVKPKDRILVAYFGDGTFAWCNSWQLKPFEDNFVEMSRQSSSKNFLKAVEKAVEEVARLVESEMACSCVPKEHCSGLGRLLAENAGIKEGILAPIGGIEKFSTASFEPVEFLAAVKCIAPVATTSNMLELTVLKSWLMAINRTKGVYQLSSYHEPQPIPGLEDDGRNLAVISSNYDGGIEVNIGGPVEEDWLSSPRGSKFDQTTENSLQRCRGVSEDRLYQRRKQKSIAEIMGGEAEAEAETKEDNVIAEEANKLASSSKSKKRKGVGGIVAEGMNVEERNEDKNVDKGTIAAKSATSGRKKRKDHVKEENHGKAEVVDAKAGVDSSKSADMSKRKRKKRSDEPSALVEEGIELSQSANLTKGKKKTKKNTGSDEAEADRGNNLISKLRSRKNLQPGESASKELISGNETNGSRINDKTGKSPLLRGRKKRQSSNVEYAAIEGKQDETSQDVPPEKMKNITLRVQVDHGDEQIERGPLSRERKKSKYLSPPYTNLDRAQRRRELEAEFLKAAGEAQIGEQVTEVASQLGESSSILKSGSEEIQKKEGDRPSDNPALQAPKQDLNIDQVNVSAASNVILKSIRSAAISPLRLNKSNSLDVVGGFFSAFRSSVYSDGSNYSSYKKHQSGRKRRPQEPERRQLQEQNESGHSSPDSKLRRRKVSKTEESKLGKSKAKHVTEVIDKTHDKQSERKTSERGRLVKEQDQSEHVSSDHKTRQTKAKRSEEVKTAKPKAKQAAGAPDMMMNNIDSDGNDSGGALFLTFEAGCTLPSKKDLLRIYGKFGALNEEQTKMFNNNHCARVVFLNISDAEEAFNDSQLASPFGSANVSFRLRYLSAETKTREIRELAKGGAKTPEKPSATRNVSQLNYIKQKLEKMTSLLEATDGKLSPNTKSKLEDEMQGLLEEVSTMAGPSSS